MELLDGVEAQNGYWISDTSGTDTTAYFETLYRYWTDRGYHIPDDRHRRATIRYVSVENPADGYRMGLTEGANGRLSIGASSPCVWPDDTLTPQQRRSRVACSIRSTMSGGEQVRRIHLRVPCVSGSGTLHVCIFHGQVRRRESPLIVFSHGFAIDGPENAAMFVRAARRLNTLGYSAVLFDHKGTGYSDGDYVDFRVLEGAKNLSNVTNTIAKRLGKRSVVTWGQSLGTAIAAISWSKYSPTVELAGLVLWHMSADISERYERVFGPGLRNRDTFCLSHKGYIVSTALLREVEDVDVLAELSRAEAPRLFVNGTHDQIGDSRYAREALAIAPDGSSFQMIEGGTHTFLCQPDQEREAIEASIRFIEGVSRVDTDSASNHVGR